MKSSELKACPSCNQELQPIPSGRENIAAECNSCGFFASTRDVARAEYLATFRPLPSIAVAAQRIAGRAPLNYSSAVLAS